VERDRAGGGVVGMVHRPVFDDEAVVDVERRLVIRTARFGKEAGLEFVRSRQTRLVVREVAAQRDERRRLVITETAFEIAALDEPPVADCAAAGYRHI